MLKEQSLLKSEEAIKKAIVHCGVTHDINFKAEGELAVFGILNGAFILKGSLEKVASILSGTGTPKEFFKKIYNNCYVTDPDIEDLG